mgnify:CR=1 FL=1
MRSVLHVGNIAHNAYFNELILRKMGRSGCVVHHDAYHFASCPQWLKLSDQGIDRESLGDDFFPNFFQFKKSEELAGKMKTIISDPDDESGVGKYARYWFIKNHSSRSICLKL